MPEKLEFSEYNPRTMATNHGFENNKNTLEADF
jgi:hypothetical protein